MLRVNLIHLLIIMAFLNSRFLCFRVLKQLNKYEYKGRTVIRQLNTRIFMSTLVGGTRGVLHKRVKDALSGAFQGTDIEVSDSLVMPTQPQHGDYQTNIAMTLTKKLGMKPKEIADKIVNALKVDDLVSVVNITGPGFITMRLSDTYVQSQILEKAKDKTRLGIAKLETPQRVIVDFSSPNIAKEMHVVSNNMLKIFYSKSFLPNTITTNSFYDNTNTLFYTFIGPSSINYSWRFIK